MSHVTSRSLYRQQLKLNPHLKRPNAVDQFNQRNRENAETFGVKYRIDLHPTKGFGHWSRRGKRGNRT